MSLDVFLLFARTVLARALPVVRLATTRPTLITLQACRQSRAYMTTCTTVPCGCPASLRDLGMFGGRAV
jgi:hypothetical protein